ncbi:threonine/serine exporter family protein [Propionibacterium acidifaciens]
MVGPVPSSVTPSGHDAPHATLIAQAAQILYTNGETTHATTEVVGELNALFGTDYTLVPSWPQLSLLHPDGTIVRAVPTRIEGINMRRVSRIHKALHAPGGPDRAGLTAAVTQAARLPACPTWLFCLACGVGATMMSLLYGIGHVHSVALLFAASALGGLLRRVLPAGAGQATRALAAAFVAGLAGALSVHLGWSSSARLIAVCPGMMLVPGPQLLNACMDIARHRHDLAVARICEAGLTILAIAAGIIGGLALGGADLPVTARTGAIPLWLDVLAAAGAACCFPVFFSMPYRTIILAFLAGALGHGVRWLAINDLGWSAPAGALLDCLVVSLVATPICRLRHVPFAGVGFASVVALVPGVYLFRGMAGLITFTTSAGDPAEALATMTDLTTAGFIIVAMAIGLIAPHRLIDAWMDRLDARRARGRTSG